MSSAEALMFVEHGDEVVVSDKPHCGDCLSPEVTDKPHCGDCITSEATDKPHCGDCIG